MRNFVPPNAPSNTYTRVHICRGMRPRKCNSATFKVQQLVWHLGVHYITLSVLSMNTTQLVSSVPFLNLLLFWEEWDTSPNKFKRSKIPHVQKVARILVSSISFVLNCSLQVQWASYGLSYGVSLSTAHLSSTHGYHEKRRSILKKVLGWPRYKTWNIRWMK